MRIYKDLYEKTKKITFTDYDAHYEKDPDYEYVWVHEENVNSMIDELLYLVDELQEKYDDLKQDIADNYKYIGSYYE